MADETEKKKPEELSDLVQDTQPTNSIDDKLDLPEEFEVPTDQRTIVGKAYDLAVASGMGVAAFTLGGTHLLASYLMGGIAYSLGHVYEVMRGKVKFNWRDFFKEWKLGGVFGIVTYGAYDLLGQYSNPQTPTEKWKETAGFIGGIVGTIPLYRGFVYLRDTVGISKFMQSIYNGGWKKHLKDAWNYDIKQNWFKKALATAIFLTPVQYVILNYVPSALLQTAAGKVLTFFQRLILGGKGAIKGPKPVKTIDDSVQETYKMNQPNYSPNQGYVPQPAYAGNGYNS